MIRSTLRTLLLIPVLAPLGLAGCAAGDLGDGAPAVPEVPTTRVCSSALHCFAHVVTDDDHRIQFSATTPSGYGPADLQSAYALKTVTASPGTVAIVDAYDYPAAESDLAKYRAQFGLPPCTVANGCFARVNQTGSAAPLPAAAPPGDDWTIEAALDLDMASAACPTCKLVLVEADDDAGDGLYVAQNGAAKLAPKVISNSWGGPEGSVATLDANFDQPGIGIFAASGDNGYDDGGNGPLYPSTSTHVTAVGGTSLAKSTGSRGWTEAAWAQAGSSCSMSIAKPSWQKDPSCQNRAAADVSAVADPSTGLAVYNGANGGWIVVGGTSAATPLVAAIYTLYGIGGQAPSWAYSHASKFFDVTSGANGSCTGALCNAGDGWDGPTGVGTPNGAEL